MNKTIFCALLLAFLFSFSLFSQEVIHLKNPSFEDSPKHSTVPQGWQNCGFPNESPPDIQPGQHEVKQIPVDGKSYLGLVARSNDTYESVGQELENEMIAGQEYEFSVYLTRSGLYLSPDKNNGNQMTNHATPIKLRIYGGNDECEKAEMLAESGLVINTRWLNYEFELKPTQNFKYLILEAHYRTPTLHSYNGNILLDNASDLIPKESTAPKE